MSTNVPEVNPLELPLFEHLYAARDLVQTLEGARLPSDARAKLINLLATHSCELCQDVRTLYGFTQFASKTLSDYFDAQPGFLRERLSGVVPQGDVYIENFREIADIALDQASALPGFEQEDLLAVPFLPEKEMAALLSCIEQIQETESLTCLPAVKQAIDAIEKEHDRCAELYEAETARFEWLKGIVETHRIPDLNTKKVRERLAA